ncbi:MAG: TGS domain-containing protein [Parabacteroides sp.]
MVRNSRLGCVSDRTEKNIDNWIEKFKAVLQDIAYHSQENSFMESVVTSFYNDDIMVFTPQGRPIILPQKATALDFAFEIHSRIGEHAQYARVNGKLCSIKTVLHRGDCVEIGVNEHINPRPDWINHVLTYKAKRHLRSFLFRMKKIPYKRCPYCHPLPGDEVIGFTETDKCVTIHKRDCSSAICLASQKGDSIVSVNFEEDKDILYPVSISIKAVDRYHLLSDLIDSITNRLKLPIVNLTTVTVDEIVDCTIDFSVHSVEELQDVMAHVNTITGVDEVQRRELK